MSGMSDWGLRVMARFLRLVLGVLVATTVAPGISGAQTPTTPATVTLSATTGGITTALPASTNPYVLMQNSTGDDVYYTFGTTNAVTATIAATTPYVPAGGCKVEFVGSQGGFIAGITPANNSSVKITSQQQPLPASCPGAGGGGSSGSSTVNQGTSAALANAWGAKLVQGGALNSLTNPIFVSPSTGSTFAATQSGNWTSRVVGNGGATLDGTIAPGTAPANMIVGGAVYNSSPPAPTTGQSLALQSDVVGNLLTGLNKIAGVTPTLGNVANASSIAGMLDVVPVGRYNSTQAAITDGQYGMLQLAAHGSLITSIGGNGASFTSQAGVYTPNTLGDATNGDSALVVDGFNWLFNGTNWDRARSNIDTAAIVTLAAAGAGTTNSADQTNYNGRGTNCVLNISASSGTISVTVAIQGKDVASGQYYTMLISAAQVANGVTPITVSAGTPAVTNVSDGRPLPRTWRAQVVSGTGVTPSVTATVGCSVIR